MSEHSKFGIKITWKGWAFWKCKKLKIEHFVSLVGFLTERPICILLVVNLSYVIEIYTPHNVIGFSKHLWKHVPLFSLKNSKLSTPIWVLETVPSIRQSKTQRQIWGGWSKTERKLTRGWTMLASPWKPESRTFDYQHI